MGALTITLGLQVITGASVSFTVTVNVQVDVLTPSDAVTVTVVTPDGKLCGDVIVVAPILYVIVGDAVQLSVAVATKLSNAVHTPGSLFVTIFAGHVSTGAVPSITVTLNVQVAVLPEPSIAVHVTAVVPTGKVLPGK
jgi:hypothetical protein